MPRVRSADQCSRPSKLTGVVLRPGLRAGLFGPRLSDGSARPVRYLFLIDRFARTLAATVDHREGLGNVIISERTVRVRGHRSG